MTPIQNIVHIFFDYISAIITSTTINVLSSTVGINDFVENNLSYSVYPKPTNGVSGCYFIHDLNDKYVIEVLDITGRSLAAYNGVHSGFNIDFSGKCNGMYFVYLKSARYGVISAKKIVVR